jgi:hypothetical protein
VKIVVYTCTFPDYDFIHAPFVLTPGVEYVLYAPTAPQRLKGWQWRPLPPAVEGFSQTMANRYCKFFPHRLFPEADVTIYLDGNILVRGDLRPLIEEFLASGAEIGLFRHPYRGTLDEELAFCKQVGKVAPADAAKADAQLAGYLAEGLPPDRVMTQNGVILRRHDGPCLEATMQLWWEHMLAHVPRDQLSGPYVMWKTGLAMTVWPWIYSRENPYFLWYPPRAKHASPGFDLEMHAFVQRHRPGLRGQAFGLLHAMIKRLRGTGPSRARPRGKARAQAKAEMGYRVGGRIG